jgi:hypothetical protein
MLPPAGEILSDDELSLRSENKPTLCVSFKKINTLTYQVTSADKSASQDVPETKLGHRLPDCGGLGAAGFPKPKDLLIVADGVPQMSSVEIDAATNCKQPVGSLLTIFQSTFDLAACLVKVPSTPMIACQQLGDRIVTACQRAGRMSQSLLRLEGRGGTHPSSNVLYRLQGC